MLVYKRLAEPTETSEGYLSETARQDVFDSMVRRVQNARGIVLTTHATPDADGLGTALAVRDLLESLGRPCRLLSEEPIDHLKVLPGTDRILQRIPEGFDYDTVMTFDCGVRALIPAFEGLDFARAFVINIDHHYKNSKFGQCNYIVAGGSSAEITYPLWQALGIPLSKHAATNLFAGAYCDSASFDRPQTAETWCFAGALVEAGADQETAMRAYNAYSLRDFAMWRDIVIKDNMEFWFDGRVVVAVVDGDRFEQESIHVPDFVSRMEKALLSFTLIAKSDGHIKISIRSSDKRYSAPRIAWMLGHGGGREGVAATVVRGRVDEWKQKIYFLCLYKGLGNIKA